MSRRELLCLQHRERQLDEQIKDLQERLNRYDQSKQMALRLTVTRLESRLRQVRYTLCQHEAQS